MPRSDKSSQMATSKKSPTPKTTTPRTTAKTPTKKPTRTTTPKKSSKRSISTPRAKKGDISHTNISHDTDIPLRYEHRINPQRGVPLSDISNDPLHQELHRIGNPIPRAAPTPPPTTDIERMLNIKWSKYIPNVPTAKQLAALMLENTKELLYGGALGGGKSDFLAYEALRFCDMPDFTSIIFRKQLTDLKQPKSLIPRVAQWLEPFRASGECRYIAADHRWDFKTVYPGTDIPGPPAMLQWGYIGDAGIRERYQSAEYQLVGFDELGQWNTPVDWLFMCSRIRATVCPIHGKDSNNDPIWHPDCHICQCKKRIPLRRRAAMNPGPAWVKKRFQIVPDPRLYKTRQAALIAIQEGEKINWVGTHPYRRFIPAYLSDNPHLSEKDYREMLAEMTEDERSRLEDGNWESRKNARFKRKWVNGQYINLYSHGYSFLDMEMNESITYPYSSLKTIFITVDAASTAKLYAPDADDAISAADGRKSQKPSSTCIGVWGVTYDEQLLWLDFRKFRKELPDIIETLVELNNQWSPLFNKIEVNGVGIGVAQFAELAGLPVRKNQRKSDKLENSLSAQMMMKHGQIYMAANTPWAEEAEDDIFNWTGDPDEEDDTVDILSDAALEITPKLAKKVVHARRIPTLPRSVPTTSPYTAAPIYGLPTMVPRNH